MNTFGKHCVFDKFSVRIAAYYGKITVTGSSGIVRHCLVSVELIAVCLELTRTHFVLTLPRRAYSLCRRARECSTRQYHTSLFVFCSFHLSSNSFLIILLLLCCCEPSLCRDSGSPLLSFCFLSCFLSLVAIVAFVAIQNVKHILHSQPKITCIYKICCYLLCAHDAHIALHRQKSYLSSV